MYTLLIIDDEYIVRFGLKTTIDWEYAGIEVIGEASDGREGLEMIKKLRPDIVLSDVCMPGMSGIELLTELSTEKTRPVFVMLSGYDEFSFAKAALNNGAFAYILKPINDKELLETMCAAAAKVRKDNYHENLEKSLPILRKHFLEDLLQTGRITAQMYEEEIRLFNFDLYSGAYMVIYFITNAEREADADGMAEMIEKNFMPYHPHMKILINRHDRNIMVLVTFAQSGSDCAETVKQCCRSVINDTKDEYIITAGLSSVSDNVERVTELYREAVKAASFNNNSEFSSVIDIAEANWDNVRREVRSAIAYINENYRENITVKTIANKLYMSRSNLMRIFREETGMTFNEYLTKIRIETAKKLLVSGRYKVYEVSDMVGYSDVKYFSQIFRKLTGSTPSDFVRISE